MTAKDQDRTDKDRAEAPLEWISAASAPSPRREQRETPPQEAQQPTDHDADDASAGEADTPDEAEESPRAAEMRSRLGERRNPGRAPEGSGAGSVDDQAAPRPSDSRGPTAVAEDDTGEVRLSRPEDEPVYDRETSGDRFHDDAADELGAEAYEEHYQTYRPGLVQKIADLIIDYRRPLIAGAAVLVVLLLAWILIGALSGGEEQTDTAQSGAADSDTGVRDTGVTLGPLEVDGEEATLESGDLSWEGRVTEGEQGKTLTLEGPTAAQFEQGFDLGDSQITSGIFAVAQQDGPVVHATTHTYSSDATETTRGSYYLVEGAEVTSSGSYVDRREEGSERVVRTYTEDGGDTYRVSFQAPENTPVPLLVGWRGPEGSSTAPDSATGS